MCDLKAAQMNMNCCLIPELMLYAFELRHKAIQAIKNIFGAKSEGGVDHITATRLAKKFRLDF